MKLKFEQHYVDDNDRTPMMRSLIGAIQDKCREDIDVDFFRDRCEPAGEGESPLKFLLSSVDRRLKEHNEKLDKLRIERAQIIASIGVEFADSISQTIEEEEAKVHKLNLIRARSEDVKRMIDDIVRMLRLTPKFHYNQHSDYEYFETIYSIGGIESDVAVTMSLKIECERGKNRTLKDIRTHLIIGAICANRRVEGRVICMPLVKFSRGWMNAPSPSECARLNYYNESMSQYDWAILKWIEKTVCEYDGYPDIGLVEDIKDEEVNSNGHET